MAAPATRQKESVDRDAAERLAKLVASASKRKHEREHELAAAARAVATVSVGVRDALFEVSAGLVRRAGYDRPIFAAALRALAEAGDARVTGALAPTLATEGAAGLVALSAAAFVRAPALAAPLAKLVTGRQTHVAFAADVARVARGESNGALLASLAPKLKEDYRIALCREVFLPLRHGPALRGHAHEALAVLRGAERHLGRWLIFAELAQRAGDMTPRAEALSRAAAGASAARAAWGLVAWALGAPEALPPRPGLEVLTRLSDRPSSSRDIAFAFRMADARVASVRGPLELVVRDGPSPQPATLRAAFYLARDFGRDDCRLALRAAAADAEAPQRGLAAALLFDLGERVAARAALDEEKQGGSPIGLAWAALAVDDAPTAVVNERTFRELASSLGPTE